MATCTSPRTSFTGRPATTRARICAASRTPSSQSASPPRRCCRADLTTGTATTARRRVRRRLMSREALEQLVQRWTDDPDFREALQRDPDGAIDRAGYQLNEQE